MPEVEPRRPEVPDAEEDAALMRRLGAVLVGEKLYLDPDLTLARLARRLRVPAKTLSATINRVTGENVSRHVNRCRVDHARGLLAAGQSVTEAMLGSGFNTKSNFNREFARITGGTPSAWRETSGAGAGSFAVQCAKPPTD